MTGFLERFFGGPTRGDGGELSAPPAEAVAAHTAPSMRGAATPHERQGHARGSFAPPPELVVKPGGPIQDARLPRVSVVILNLNGRHHLQGCFESLRELEYPRERLEVVLVDNASSDGSVDEMRAHHAWVKLHVNERNVGFSAGCNQGARLADRPEILVFLNNDMRVERDFVRELVSPIVRGECQATSGKMFSWDGKRINSAGGGMNFHGLGIQRGYEEAPGPEFDIPMRTLFACGGAMAMDARVFHDVGGFDEEFFAYYEDVDLGWRTWVQGHSVHYAPRAVCYHHHSSTSRRLPPEMVRLIQTRNPVLACLKNYDEANLRLVLAPMLGLFVRRMWMVSGLHEADAEFRIELATNPAAPGAIKRLLEKAHERLNDTIEIKRTAAADLVGINDVLGRWDHWMARRAVVQAKRRRPDAEIFQLFLKPHWCIEGESGYAAFQRGATSLFGLDRILPADSLPDPKG